MNGCTTSSCASSCAATSATCSMAMNVALMSAVISSAHANSYYDYDDDEDDKFYGTIKVNLTGTTEKYEKAEGWLKKIFVGDKEWEEEIVTQTDYLKKIYDVFSELGYKNVLFLDMDGETVYEDTENKDDDFDKAIQMALKEKKDKDYKIGISLDTTGDEKGNILIAMNSKHDSGEFPLTIDVISDEDPKEIKREDFSAEFQSWKSPILERNLIFLAEFLKKS
ncbi:hypothetical protein LCGC14_2882850 [marine sediment metagenome]|uniref:Uncharacterized protein n=1 Tax=marine sediment metagenome TaxID=412755 RepID=A0A0F9A7K0_9ZZZZ